MGVLSGIAPEKVFYYFEELTKIPHGSYNIDKISDYLVSFAKERNLKFVQDEAKNVIIEADATEGYENEPAIMLQGHMDMVAVKTSDCTKDMKTEGLDIYVEGDFIHAKGTSLGGDDGVAVAYMLAVLDDASLKHPKLYCIITTNEEVGLDGAKAIDLSSVKASRLINIDSEAEGVFLTSCAGGARVSCTMELNQEAVSGVAFNAKVSGLIGGHSGDGIIHEHGNSNCLMARAIKAVADKMPVHLVSMVGGLADNAIPRETECIFVVEEKNRGNVSNIIKKVAADIAGELGVKDPDFKLSLREIGEVEYAAVSAADSLRAVNFLYAMPNGVQAMSADIKGLVETSLNLGILKIESGHVLAEYSVRSSVETSKDALILKMKAICEFAGAKAETFGEYPGWKFRADSPLREKMIALYEEMYGVKPGVEAIHAGLECGILAGKVKDLDAISLGPDMYSVHTTEERLSISSTKKLWEYLVALLAKKD